MVRLLLQVYPTPRAMERSTTDADAALDDVEIVGPVTHGLIDDDFVKEGGNVLVKDLGEDRRIEINLLLQRPSGAGGIRPQDVQGVGQVDTLRELSFVMSHPALHLDVEAHVGEEILRYQTRIPDLEAAIVLKAHSWKHRRSVKDVADLVSLLEIREAHQDTVWRLNEAPLRGFRLDTSRILHDLAIRVTPRRSPVLVPPDVDRLRFAALIHKHVSR